MNDRVIELAKQAAKYADYYAMLSDNAEQEIFTKKFAELLIRECADIADTAEPFQSSDLILKHFGVEE